MEPKTISAPLSEQFIIVADTNQKFVFADSGLLEALEPLMEDPKTNLKTFLLIQEAVAKAAAAETITPDVLLLMKHLASLLLELREFDIRSSDHASDILERTDV